jgi:hypothetical protein
LIAARGARLDARARLHVGTGGGCRNESEVLEDATIKFRISIFSPLLDVLGTRH